MVNATKRMPTGRDNKAEINAICCFPSPLAIDNIASVPLILFLSFSNISFFKSVIDDSFISINSKSFLVVNCFAKLSPIKIIFS